MRRVGVAGFLHESNTFLPTPTTYEDFASTNLTRGEDLLQRWTGANHELGGFLSGTKDCGFEPVPLFATLAVPSGKITAEGFEQLANELLTSIQEAPPMDGLLIALHGATVSELFTDADGEILSRIRNLAGDRFPIVNTVDLHANISKTMASCSNATIAYRSNPHLDQQERGHEAAILLKRMLNGEILPRQALEKPPFVISMSRQYTLEEPAASLYDDVREVCKWPGIISASAAMGFYYADVEEMGVSFLAVADRDAKVARTAAKWMACRAWSRRQDFIGALPGPEEAVRLASASEEWPVVLMDVGDNVGGGSPGDSTVLFDELIRQGVPNCFVILYDPESVRACVSAGPRAAVELHVGGKTDRLHGPTVRVKGVVRTLSDGRFAETSIRHGGWGTYDQGTTAVVETSEQHTIVLTSRRMAPMSLEQVLSLGIHPERKRMLIVKGVVAPRAAYEPIAEKVILVDTPGVTSDNPRKFKYQRRRIPLYPLEPKAKYHCEHER